MNRKNLKRNVVNASTSTKWKSKDFTCVFFNFKLAYIKTLVNCFSLPHIHFFNFFLYCLKTKQKLRYCLRAMNLSTEYNVKTNANIYFYLKSVNSRRQNSMKIQKRRKKTRKKLFDNIAFSEMRFLLVLEIEANAGKCIHHLVMVNIDLLLFEPRTSRENSIIINIIVNLNVAA